MRASVARTHYGELPRPLTMLGRTVKAASLCDQAPYQMK